MATNRITKAFLPLEQRTISIEEYGKYLDGKTRWISLRNNIFCPECGDALVYAKGEIYSPYFKHSPSAQGHNYCCLYNRGYESKCWESIIRKRIFQGKDISFNYVVRYWSNSWSNYVTVPSFSEEEISINEKNNTKIQIEYGKSVRDKTIINVDSGTFYPGKIKKIKLPEIASVLSITVSGNNESHNIVLDGFKAGSQIYKYLLDQDYGNQNFTVFQKETFALKRVSGKIYTGRHYVIFVNEFSKKPDIKEYREYGIELNEVNIPKLKIDKWMKNEVLLPAKVTFYLDDRRKEREAKERD